MTRGRAAALVVAAAAVLTSYGHARESRGGDVVTNSFGMRMVLVPAGSFRMGSPPGEALRQEEETLRRVTLTRGFRMAATEVTQRQWLTLMEQNRSPQPGDDLPVTSVSWPEAREFCAKLSQKEGVTYRLPTEAEWEYACRAGDASPPAGPAELAGVAWFVDNAEGTTHPVGRKRPNAWGLFDMLGNVSERCHDWYGPYAAGTGIDPWGSASGTDRIRRGGSWGTAAGNTRAATRSYLDSGIAGTNGFRLVRVLE